MCLQGGVVVSYGLTGGWAVSYVSYSSFLNPRSVELLTHTRILFSTLQPNDTATNKQFNMLWNVAPH